MIKHVIFPQHEVLATLEGRKGRFSREIKPAHQPARDEIINGTRMLKPAGWPLLSEGEFIQKFSPYGHAGDQEWQTGKLPAGVRLYFEGFADVWNITCDSEYFVRSGHGEVKFMQGVRWKRMGTILCVKESWQRFVNVGDCGIGCEYGCSHGGYVYKASGNWDDEVKWLSPATMPKEAARIWVEVVGVDVKRVQDISFTNAIDHGIEYFNVDHDAFEGGELVADFPNYTWRDDPKYEDYNFPTYYNAVDSYKSLVELEKPGLWQRNPWMWGVEFRILSTDGKPNYL